MLLSNLKKNILLLKTESVSKLYTLYSYIVNRRIGKLHNKAERNNKIEMEKNMAHYVQEVMSNLHNIPSLPTIYKRTKRI